MIINTMFSLYQEKGHRSK